VAYLLQISVKPLKFETMRTIEVRLYQFDELSEQAKKNVIEANYDINVDHYWWDFTYEDSEEIGIKITEFDLYHRTINGKLLLDPAEVKKLVVKNHGKQCGTYQYAMSWDMRHEIDQDEFLRGMLREYLKMLQENYDYYTSEEAIIETIRANEYEFTEDGEMY
jgi:hypothetical protein